MLAEADAGRDRDIGLRQQQLGEGERAQLGEVLGDRRPGEHRWPAAPAASQPAARQALDQHVAALLVGAARLGDAVLRAVQRRGRRHLDRREGAVVEIRLDAGQRRDQRLVAGGEADAPAGHRIGLAHRGELDGDVARARHLQDRGRRLAVEIDLGIGEVATGSRCSWRLQKSTIARVEIEIDDLRRRVRRIVQHQRDRLAAPCGAPRARAPAGTPRARCCPAPGCGAPSRRR